MLLAAAGLVGARGQVGVREIEVTLERLPASLSGYRIVQLSDLHWGNGPDATVRRLVARAAALQPDVAVLTGDFVDDRGPGTRGLAEVLEPLRGAWAVLGDHDHTDPEAVARALRHAGIRVLVNESVQLPGGLWLGGVDDLEVGRCDLAGTLRDLPEHGGLLLSHNPLVFERLAEDLPLLVLAGHTHGAQIRIPFPWPALVCRWHLQVPTVQGWYRRGRLRLYVNRGVGVAGPWPLNRRVLCPPEVSVFDLRPAVRRCPPAAAARTSPGCPP
jgi:predicted MPP superfamily phosphohydrolase